MVCCAAPADLHARQPRLTPQCSKQVHLGLRGGLLNAYGWPTSKSRHAPQQTSSYEPQQCHKTTRREADILCTDATLGFARGGERPCTPPSRSGRYTKASSARLLRRAILRRSREPCKPTTIKSSRPWQQAVCRMNMNDADAALRNHASPAHVCRIGEEKREASSKCGANHPIMNRPRRGRAQTLGRMARLKNSSSRAFQATLS